MGWSEDDHGEGEHRAAAPTLVSIFDQRYVPVCSWFVGLLNPLELLS